MSIEKVPVVTILTDNGPVEINKSDYDKDKHEITKETKQPEFDLAKEEAAAYKEDAKRSKPAIKKAPSASKPKK